MAESKGKPVGTAYAVLDLDSNKMEQGLKRVHDTLVKGTIKTEDAFKQLGIKSDATYEKMRVNALLAFDKITSSAKTSADDRYRAEKALVDKLKSLHDQQHGVQIKNIDQTKTALESLGGAFKVAMLAAAAYKAIEIGKELVNSGLAAERLALSLKAATGSYQASISAMQFLRTESIRLGTDLFSSADGFVKLTASARGTNLEGSKTKEIFTAISTASAALKLTNDQTAGAIMAISQMMSKGTVQAEELRGQLGERLPGAFNMAAKAMGVTTAELGKMLEKGEVISSDFLPRFARVLTHEYGQAATDAADSTQAAVNRMNNAWEEAKRTIGESLLPAVARAAVAINNMIQSIAPANMTDLEKIGELTAKVENLKGRVGAFGMEYVLGDELKKAESDLKKLEYATAGVSRETGAWARGVREVNQALSDRFSKGDSWRSYFPGKEAADDRGAKEYLKALQDETPKAEKAARNYFETIKDMAEFHPYLDMVSDIKEHVKALEEAEKKAIEYRNKLNVLLIPSNYNSDSFIGMSAANKRADKMLEDAAKTMSEMEVLSKRTAEAMEKNFSDFFFDTMTGKFNSFESFLEGILQSMLRMVADYMGQIARTIMFGSEANKIGGIFGSILNSFGSSEPTPLGYNALGGVYAGAGISAYSGQVVNRPTVFPFARGIGIMGEAGPEAIMPLTRTASGKLGVKAEGGGLNMVMNITNNAPAEIKQPKVDFDGQRVVLNWVIDGLNRDVDGFRGAMGGR